MFGIKCRDHPLVGILNLKWCTAFKLLGINFNRMLQYMDRNYKKTLEEIKSDRELDV